MSNRPNLELATAPSLEPLTLAETKNYLKVSGTDDDTLITGLIVAVRQSAEKFLKSALISQSWKISYDQYAPSVIKLLMGPVQSVTSVTAVARGGTSTVISSSAYYLSSGNKALIFDANVIGHRVEIVYVTGYGATAAYVPPPIKHGMLAHIAAIYDGRAGETVIPPQVRALYHPYRLMSL